MKTRVLRVGAVGVMTLALAASVALADLTVKEQTQMSGMMGMLSSKGAETTYIKGEKMRTESHTEMGGAMAGMMQGAGGSQVADVLTITRLDKGVVWFVNHEDSTYVEMPLKGGAADSLGQVKVKDVKVTKTGRTKEIVGYKCEGVDVTIELEIAMSEGEDAMVQTHTVTTLFWMRPEVKDLEELRYFWDQMVDVAKVSQQGSPMAEAMGPLFAKVKEIQGVPLGMDMTMANPMGGSGGDAEQQAEMKEAMKMVQQMMKQQGKASGDAPEESAADDSGAIKVTRQVTSITKGAIGDGLFEVPKGYKKTTQSMPQMMKEMGE